MPTQEERLTKLEFDFNQFKAESTTYYQEMAMQVTMTKGLTEDAVKRLMQLRIQVDKRFTSVDQEIGEIKSMLAQVLARLPEKPRSITAEIAVPGLIIEQPGYFSARN